MVDSGAFVKSAVLMGALCALCDLAAAQMEMPPAPVEYVAAASFELSATVSLTGTVQARRRGVVSASVSAVVETRYVEVGDRVTEGLVLIEQVKGPTRLRLNTATAAIEESGARLAQADLDLTRARDLFGKGVATQQDLDRARSEQNAWRATVSRLEAEAAQIRDELDRLTLYAPYDGVVIGLHTERGAMLSAGATALEMAAVDDLEVWVSVPERHFTAASRASMATITLPALDGLVIEGGKPVLVPHQTATARTFPVRIPFTAPDRIVPPGMLVEVVLGGGPADAVLIVPKDAIVNTTGTFFVYSFDDERGVRPIPVEPGAAIGGWVSIQGEVEVGTPVITKGNERLRAGQRVAPSPADYERPTP